MSAASVTAYLSPTILRTRAISSDESCGPAGFTIFISVTCVTLVPPHRSTAQPVVDGFAEPVMRYRHDSDGARAFCVERTKIAEKIGGGLVEIALRGQIHHRGRRVNSRYRIRAKRQQRLAGRDGLGIEPHFRTRRVMRGQHARWQRLGAR